MNEKIVVIGGEGFVGNRLVRQLKAKYPKAQVTSISKTQRNFEPGYRFISTNITSLESIENAFTQSEATTVFHTASPHATATKQQLLDINVEGTKKVLEACYKTGVKRLIFTSSLAACYNEEPLTFIDERLPLVTDGRDMYTSTKAMAEELIIKSNGIKGLLTCALRLGGVIGEGDVQVIPHTIDVFKSYPTCFQVGDNSSLIDFVCVSNAVQAHILAFEGLCNPNYQVPENWDDRLSPVYATVPKRVPPSSRSVEPPFEDDAPLPAARSRFDQFFVPPRADKHPIAGEVFFIGNGEPVPFWTMMRYIGYSYNGHIPPFVLKLPASMVLFFVGIFELFVWFWAVIRFERYIPPLMSVAHVRYSCTDFCANIEKARRILGYKPEMSLEEGVKETIRWIKAEEERTKESKKNK